jgi:uncharacterized protein (DUF305 family)
MEDKINNYSFIFIFIILFLIAKHYNLTEQFSDKFISEKNNIKDVCRGNLSNKEYLEHMIPHHQVAVDISIMLQKTSKIPIMQKVLRELVFVQKEEILIMKEILKEFPSKITNKSIMLAEYIPDKSDYIKPNELGLTSTYCDPHFFDPESHMKHMHHMKLDEIMYIEHMIPHHQVAVDMSKVLLKNTNNDFMIHLAYRIIRNQQHEILMLTDLLNNLKNKNIYKFKSDLLI